MRCRRWLTAAVVLSVLCTLGALVALRCVGTATATEKAATAEATAYLRTTLDWMQANAFVADQLDWQALRKSVWAQARSARTPAQTYPAIRFAVAALGDRHSRFYTPGEASHFPTVTVYGPGYELIGAVVVEVEPGSPAARAGVLAGDVVDGRVVHATSELLVVRRAGAPGPMNLAIAYGDYARLGIPHASLMSGGIGYLELPAGEGAATSGYAAAGQTAIRGVDQQGACGWVIDLRRNVGGDMWAMLLALGPILGEGKSGAWQSHDGARFDWSYRDGRAFQADELKAALPDTPYRLSALPPVAVLTSPLTASAAEAMAIAFIGRPNTRSFGEPTWGIPTGNTTHLLADGAVVTLITAIAADRTGQTYGGSIAPDQPVAMDWTQLGTANDAIMNTAAAWLKTQPGCGP